MFLACTASNSIWKIIIISNNCVKDCCSMNWHNGLLQRSINTFPVPNTGFLPLRTPLVTITELTPQGIFLCDILFEEGIIPFLAQYCQSKLQATRGCSLPFPGQAAHYEIHLPLTHTCIYIQQLSKSAVGIILPCCPGQTLHLKEITVQSSKSWVSVSLTAAGCRSRSRAVMHQEKIPIPLHWHLKSSMYPWNWYCTKLSCQDKLGLHLSN